MLSFTTIKGGCTGCSACMAVCPVNCISMEKDQEGFLYPISSDACIKCGKCERVCPVSNHKNTANQYNQHAYACLSMDDAIWRRSASGGAFSEICLAWGDEKTIVVGAAWDKFMVGHVCIEGTANIKPLCKSKYVASSLDNTFCDIRSFLLNGRKVIFCGTPCQVAGLKSFLNRSFDNLLTIDLICHGVGSPSVFLSSIHLLERKYKMDISHYEFRAKKEVYDQDYISCISSNKSERYITKDPYIQLFLEQICLRPSCGKNCVFRDSNRQGDLTIADFKGLKEIFPDIDTKRNYSTIVTNSCKGDSVIISLRNKMEIRECSIENVIRYNPLFSRQTWFSSKRDLFFHDFIVNPEKAIKKWRPKDSLKVIVYNLLPMQIQKLIRRMKHT